MLTLITYTVSSIIPNVLVLNVLVSYQKVFQYFLREETQIAVWILDNTTNHTMAATKVTTKTVK